MRTRKQFLLVTALCSLTVFFLGYVLLHNTSSQILCLTCSGEDGGSPVAHGGVESISLAKQVKEDSGTSTPPSMPRDDNRTFTHSSMPREDSRTPNKSPNKKIEDGRTLTFPNMPKGYSRAFTSPYLYAYNEIPLCLNYTRRPTRPTAHDKNRTKADSKLILYWQPHEVFPAFSDFNYVCRRPLSRPCEITFDERLHAKADAVIFHASRLYYPKPPFKKRRGQIWIARGLESPIHWNPGYRSAVWRRKFNWTMTYRPDSEIFQPVGSLMEIPEQQPGKDFRAIAANKTRSVAWFVSDCRTVSRREEYVKQLKKHIDVDIFGSCGPLDCPKHESECDDMLSEKYRFYLSFENSFCPHYVTEKFFRKYSRFNESTDVIPVVRGGADYGKYFPKGTFINSADFRSPKELAHFLKTFGANTEAYAAMLKRKSLFRTVPCAKKEPWCKLCEMLHDTHMTSNVYEDLAAWWDKEACLEIKDVKDVRL